MQYAWYIEAIIRPLLSLLGYCPPWGLPRRTDSLSDEQGKTSTNKY